ncbi:YheU family protein [Vreelandella utahensis]|uniref:YheU family protein n=1 Tax=Vreelandella halophila TaxID=86177 RepID=UPI000986479A|nr:YheU family protein [Halomonas utahensis]
MVIPSDQLSADALEALIEEYCLRETGSMEVEDPLATCREQVASAVARGRLVVLYTPYNPNQVAALVPADQLDDNEGPVEQQGESAP